MPVRERWYGEISSDWTGVAGDFARNNPIVYKDMVILGDQAGNKANWDSSQSKILGDGAKIIAVDAHSGNKIWVTQVEAYPTAMVTSSPVVFNDVVYVGIASAEENLAATLGAACCYTRGSVVALDVKTGKILWQTYMVPDNGGLTGGYSGGGIWDSTPVIDAKRNSIYVGTGNNYSVPISVETCFAQNNKNPSCTDSTDYFDSVVALDLNSGKIKWAKWALYYDAWNVNCIETVTPPSPIPSFAPGPNCPFPNGPDFDFGGPGPNLYSVESGEEHGRGRDILGVGEKSGIYWALNPDDGTVVWNAQVGPGSALGGIEWGTAFDGKHIYVPISNQFSIPYALAPSGGRSTVDRGPPWILGPARSYGRLACQGAVQVRFPMWRRAAWGSDRQVSPMELSS
jgi:polyvinyl alcohol dehydrogenase (cytochrome)